MTLDSSETIPPLIIIIIGWSDSHLLIINLRTENLLIQRHFLFEPTGI